MAQLKKLLLAVVIVCVVFFISCAVLIRLKGKELIEGRASAMLDRPVTIAKASFIFPIGVHLTDLNIEGLLFAPVAEVRCSLMAFLGRNFELSEVLMDGPILTLHRGADNQIIWDAHKEAEHVPAESSAAKPMAANGAKLNTVIRSLNVYNGQIHFPGHEANYAWNVSVHNVHLTARNVPLSGQPADTAFDCQGELAGEDFPLAGDTVKGHGLINWPLRNMEASFIFENIKGETDLEVELASKDNAMMVQGHLKTNKMFDAGKKDASSGDNLFMDALNKSNMAIDMDFSFPTRMDRWELSNIEFSGNLNASIGGKDTVSGK